MASLFADIYCWFLPSEKIIKCTKFITTKGWDRIQFISYSTIPTFTKSRLTFHFYHLSPPRSECKWRAAKCSLHIYNKPFSYHTHTLYINVYVCHSKSTRIMWDCAVWVNTRKFIDSAQLYRQHSRHRKYVIESHSFSRKMFTKPWKWFLTQTHEAALYLNQFLFPTVPFIDICVLSFHSFTLQEKQKENHKRGIKA